MLPRIALVVSIAALFGLISTRWLRLPIVVGTMLCTVLLSAGLVLTSLVHPGLRQYAQQSLSRVHYDAFVLHGLLSLLLFAGAFLMDLESLAEQKFVVGVFAIFGTLISTGLTCVLLFYTAALFGMHLPWIECLLFASLISPTDPIAVIEMLRRIATPRHLQAQLAGESLFNDGVGAVLFLTSLGIAESGAIPTIGHVATSLLVEAGGGLLLGVLLALPIARLMRSVDAYQIDILLTLALALGGYALAERCHLSAPLEAVAGGIALRWESRRNSSNIAHAQIEHFWTAIDEVQNSILFVLMGLEALAVKLRISLFGLGALAILVVNFARFATVSALFLALRKLSSSFRSSLPVIAWDGLRGGLSIALALSIPDRLGREWIFATTYTVVVFSIVVKGGTMARFLERFAPLA